MSLKSFEFTSHEESRWNGNCFSRTIFWENMQLDLLGGIFFKKQQTGGPNNKTRIGTKILLSMNIKEFTKRLSWILPKLLFPNQTKNCISC